jgi:YD repeat-containing protein
MKACRLLLWASVALCPVVVAQPATPISPAPVVGYEYNANGKATRSILAPGVTGFNFATTNTYDSLDRVKDTTDARNGIAQLGYNGRSDLIQVTDPRNLVTQYPRNGLSDPTSLVSPDTGTATHSFDAAGNLATRTDSRGVLGTYTYDAANRLTGITYSQSGQPSLSYSWTYDQTDIGYSHGIGRLTSTVHPSGSTQHAYDAQGRLLTDTQRVNAAAGANATQVSLAVTYGYDGAGNVASVVYPSGRKLTITYAGGLPSDIALAPDTTATAVTLISQIQFDPFGGARSCCPPTEEFCRKRKDYCITLCQYELDMPGRRDNTGPYRACIRRCMNDVGCNY